MIDAALDPRVRVLRLSHVTYNHIDLIKSKQFNLDFGFDIVEETEDTIYYSGYGVDPFSQIQKRSDKIGFAGSAWVVESRDELVKASKMEGASEITNFEAPGGGEIVRMKDCWGNPVHFIFGQIEKVAPVQPRVIWNYGETDLASKERKGEFQRFERGPAKVHKLGHWGFISTDFESGNKWYTSHMNLKASDLFQSEIPDGTMIEHSAFFRLDRGEEYCDHHCFFILGAAPGSKTYVHHSSYEINDLDQQFMGHQWLASKSYELSWGVGRHVLGSQIFDYWFDPTGFRVEHYCDGDLLNDSMPTNVHTTPAGIPPSEAELAVWAQTPLSQDFLGVKAQVQVTVGSGF